MMLTSEIALRPEEVHHIVQVEGGVRIVLRKDENIEVKGFSVEDVATAINTGMAARRKHHHHDDDDDDHQKGDRE